MTRDQIIALAQAAGFIDSDKAGAWLVDGDWLKELAAFAALVTSYEREECAKVCEQTDDGTPYNLTAECAAAIRSRT